MAGPLCLSFAFTWSTALFSKSRIRPDISFVVQEIFRDPAFQRIGIQLRQVLQGF